MTFTDCTRNLERQLAESNTAHVCAAISVLMRDKDDVLYQQALLLTGQYNEIRRNQALGLSDDSHGINRINNTLIQMCADIKRAFGKEIIDAETQNRLNELPETDEKFPSKDPSVSAPSKSVFRQYLPIVAAIAVLFLGWQAYKWVSNLEMRNPDATVNTRIEQNNKDVYGGKLAKNAPNTEGSSAALALPNVKPISLDFKTSSQNVTIFDTRLYPTDGTRRLVFSGKMFCDISNRGGCNLFASFFKLKVDGQIIEAQNDNLTTGHPSGKNLGIFSGNAHEFFKLAFDIPENAQSVALIIKIEGLATAVVDLKKTITTPPEPVKRINLTQEMDLNISRNFGNSVQLLSVKAAPYDDDFFKIIVRFIKPVDTEISNSCARIISDDGLRSFDTEKEMSKNTSRLDTQLEFILPRTLGPCSLMIGNCESGQTPFKVALPL